MSDSNTRAAASMAAAQLAQLRLSGLILTVLVSRGTLLSGQAASLVQNAADFLEAEGGSPAVTGQFQEAYEQLRQQMLGLQPGSQR